MLWRADDEGASEFDGHPTARENCAVTEWAVAMSKSPRNRLAPFKEVLR